jgi:hypothetical protein
MPAVGLLRRLSCSHLPAARRAGGILAPPTFRSPRAIRLPRPPLAQYPSAMWNVASGVTLRKRWNIRCATRYLNTVHLNLRSPVQ